MKAKALTSWSWEALCLLVFLILAVNQLFLRPVTGLADNGDFPKVLSAFNLCDPNHNHDVFTYVCPRYVVSADCYWESGLPSSERLVAWVNKLIAEWSGKNSFRITGAGKTHLFFVLAALLILLWALHDASPFLRFGIPPLVILIFSDVAYLAYLNSFYMDAASLVFLLPVVALAAAWILRPRPSVAIGYGVAGVLFGLSKTQHVITAFLLAGLAACFAIRVFRSGLPVRRSGWYWATSAVAMVAAAVATLALTPHDYRAEPLYSLVFYRILPHWPDQAGMLDELGLPESDLQYAGTHSYSQDAPVMKPEWREDFVERLTYVRLATFYLRNPLLLLNLTGRGLGEAHDIRPANIGNYQREDGFPPNALAKRFDWWSNVRSRMLKVFPAQLVILYVLMGTGSLLCFLRPNLADRWPLYPLVMVLATSGTVEFLFAVLLDGTETDRHLFFFHVITELLIVCAFASLPGLFSRLLRKQGAATDRAAV